MNAASVRVNALHTVLLLAMLAVSQSLHASFVRANCRGVQELSSSETRVSCQESSVLTDEAEHLMLGHTRASASLAEGRLSISAAGGQIRDVGSNGGEAGALLMDRLTITGDWQGTVSIGVRLCVAYKFAGFGESRIHATLRTSPAENATGDNQARVRLSHRGFTGTVLTDFESRGDFAIPPAGPRDPQSILELEVTERIHRSAPAMNLRADIAAFALPNLEALEPVLSSFGEAIASIAISLPGGLGFTSESGVFLSDSETAARTVHEPEPDTSWVIMKTSDIGKKNALRSHRGWYRAVARSDCRHQFGVDG